MKEPLVSVVIPTYNRAKTIIRAIDSVLNQTYTNLELLVIDDNSKDDTERVIQEHLSDSRFRYIKLSKNIGGGGARNKGIEEAKGKYIAFQDSDDEWMLDKLEKQMAIFATYPDVDVVFARIQNNGEPNTAFPKRDITESKNLYIELLKDNYIGTVTAIIKKEKLIRVNGFDQSLPRLQDWDLFIRLSQIAKFHMLQDILCDVYLQEDSVSNSSKALETALSVFDKKYKDEIAKLSRIDRASVYEKYGSLYINDGNWKKSTYFFRLGLKEKFDIKILIKYIVVMIGGEKLYKLLK